MSAEELSQVNAALSDGRKVCVINLAAFSMAVGNITAIDESEAGVNLKLATDKGEQAVFELEKPVNVVTTPTGYRFESDKLVLQVDYLPD